MTAETPANGDAQARLIASNAPRVLALGGPGSGKTRAALLLAGRLLAQERKGSGRVVLFLTFSRAAVAELIDRTPMLIPKELRHRLEISTFHGYARSILDQFGRFDGLGSEPIIITSEHEQKLHIAPAGALIFDDLVPAAVRLIESSPWLRERLARRFIAVISDEFQDTGNEQAELLELLSAGSRLVCMADPNQMIYDFRADVTPRRLAEFEETGAEVIELESRSYRDPSGLISKVARAIADRRWNDPALREARQNGRLRVLPNTNPLYPGVVAEVRALRGAGHGSVGVFVSQRLMVEELGRELGAARIEHEIAGLDGAAGEAETVLAAMARFAVGLESWDEVRGRMAVFLTAAQPRHTPPVVALGLVGGGYLPGNLPALLDTFSESLEALAGEPTASLYAVATTFMNLFGWGERLWRTGARDLAAQTAAIAREPLNKRTAKVIEAVARRRQSDSYLDDFGAARLPVRLMTTFQAKGREMDAIILVHHPRDVLPRTTADESKLRRVHFVAVSRARQTVSIVLPVNPNTFLAPYALLGR